MVVCASPAKADASETAHVFEFAKMASEVEVTAAVPVETERGRSVDNWRGVSSSDAWAL